jgi:chloramphenicol O-acetyltransferase
MSWPLKPHPVPDSQIPAWTSYYLAVCNVPSDPTIVWGSDFPTAGLERYLRQRNQASDVILSPAHVLIRAVGCCLAAHPEFNRRVLRRRLYEFKGVHVAVPIRDVTNVPEVCVVENAHAKSEEEIAQELLAHARNLARQQSPYQRNARLFHRIPRVLRRTALRLLLHEVNAWRLPVRSLTRRLRSAGVMVNYLGHRELPPMRSFKPSRFPLESCTLNITVGPAGVDGVNGPISPLFVRADHRVVDAYQLGQFVADLRQMLMEPEGMG